MYIWSYLVFAYFISHPCNLTACLRDIKLMCNALVLVLTEGCRRPHLSQHCWCLYANAVLFPQSLHENCRIVFTGLPPGRRNSSSRRPLGSCFCLILFTYFRTILWSSIVMTMFAGPWFAVLCLDTLMTIIVCPLSVTFFDDLNPPVLPNLSPQVFASND